MVRWQDDDEEPLDETDETQELGWSINGVHIACWGPPDYVRGFHDGQESVWQAVRRRGWILPVWMLGGFLVGLLLAYFAVLLVH
jgi:hypothetical protein